MIFILIKDSLFNFAEIIDKDYDLGLLKLRLDSLIRQLNKDIEQEKNRPNSIMESKFPEYRYRPRIFEKTENYYSDGTTRYWIEQI